MKHLTRILSFGAAIALVVFAAASGKTLLERGAFLITQPHVELDLKLSASQKTQRDQVLRRYNDQSNEIREGLSETTSPAQMDQKRAQLDAILGQAETQFLAILTLSQSKRLGQIELQQEGIPAIQDQGVAAQLGLSAAQKAKIAKAMAVADKVEEAYQNALGDALAKIPEPSGSAAALDAYQKKQMAVVRSMKGREAKVKAANAARDRQVLATMTPTQRAKWKSMLGKPLKPGYK